MAGSAGSLHLFDEYYSSGGTDHFYTSNPGGENLNAYSFSASNVWTAFMGNNSKGIVGSVEVLWRYYNSTIDDHYFSRASNIHQLFSGWVREGAVGHVYGSSGSNRFAVYSHWDGSSDHKFSTSSSEPGFNLEGVAWYSPSIVTGCGDSSASNYNPYVNQSNSGCTYPVYGCTDPSADNYNSSADTNDGSCTYSGCTDPNADNYDSGADNDDGSCTYTPTFSFKFRIGNGPYTNNCTVDEGETFQIRLSWTKANQIKNTGYRIGYDFDENDAISSASLSDFNGSTSSEHAITTNSGNKTYNLTAKEDISVGEGNEVMRVDFFTKTSANSAKTYRANQQITVNDTSFEILGCTDSTAFNYDPNANTDDGSCVPVVLGCIDANLMNYDPNANTDDGSCEYTPVMNSLNHSPTDSLVYTVGGTQQKSFSLTGQLRALKQNYHLQNSTDFKGSFELVKLKLAGNGTWSVVDVITNPSVTYAGDDPNDNRFGLYDISSNNFTVTRVTDEPYEYRVRTSSDWSGTAVTNDYDFPAGSRMREYSLPYLSASNQLIQKGTSAQILVSAYNYSEPNESMIWEIIHEVTDNSRGTGFKSPSTMFVSDTGSFTITPDTAGPSPGGPLDIDNDIRGFATFNIEANDFVGEAISDATYRVRIKRQANNDLVAERYIDIIDDTVDLTTWESDIAEVRYKPSYISANAAYNTTFNWEYNESPSTDTGGVGYQKFKYQNVNSGSNGESTLGLSARSNIFSASGSDTVGQAYTFNLEYANGSATFSTFLSSPITIPVADPVTIIDADFAQSSIDDAIDYNPSTKTLKVNGSDNITIEVEHDFAMTLSFSLNGSGATTYGNTGTNGFNNPGSVTTTQVILASQLTLGDTNSLLITATGHGGGQVFETLTINAYEPITFNVNSDITSGDIGDTIQFSWTTTGSLDKIQILPDLADISSSGTVTTRNEVLTRDRNYIFKAIGLGEDVVYGSIDVTVPRATKIDYFVYAQTPVQNGDDIVLMWKLSGEWSVANINGVDVLPNTNADGSGSLTISQGDSLYSQSSTTTYTLIVSPITSKQVQVVTKEVDTGTGTQGGGEDIRYTYVLPYDSSLTDGYDFIVASNYKNIDIALCGGAGGDGGYNNGDYDGVNRITYGGIGGTGDMVSFNVPDGEPGYFKIYPGKKGQGFATERNVGSAPAVGGDGYPDGGNGGALTVASGGMGGAGGGGTLISEFNGDNLAIVAGGGGAAGGNYAGVVGEDGQDSSTDTLGAQAYFNPIQYEQDPMNGGAQVVASFGSGGGQGGGAYYDGSLLQRGPGASGEGGTSGLSLYKSSTNLLDHQSNNHSFVDSVGTFGDGFAVIQYTVGDPAIKTFTVTPINNVGSNVFDIEWDTEGMVTVEVTQEYDDGTNKVISTDPSGTFDDFFSGLFSTSLGVASGSFKIYCLGRDNNNYEQTINFTVDNALTFDVQTWNVEAVVQPNTSEPAVFLGALNANRSVKLLNEPGSGVLFGPDVSGPWSGVRTFSPNEAVYMKFQSLPYNTNVNDENGNPLTGQFGNYNPLPIKIYVDGRWIPEVNGASLVPTKVPILGNAGTGELGGFITSAETDGILLMGSYGDTTRTETRTATWYKNALDDDGNPQMKSIRISHIAGNDNNGGERPNNGSASTPEVGDVLELEIDPGTGANNIRTINLIPNRASRNVVTTVNNSFFISGNVQQYYPCASTSGSGAYTGNPNTLSAITWADDPNTPGPDIVFCWYTGETQSNDYDDEYGQWKQTEIELLPSERTSNVKFTLRSYAFSAPEFKPAVPAEIKENNQNAGDVFAIDKVLYRDMGDTIYDSDVPGTSTLSFIAKTDKPVIAEVFDFAGQTLSDPDPDIDFNEQNSDEWLYSNQITVDDIQLLRSDGVLEIRLDNPDAQIKIDDQPWTHTKEIQD
ncbi:MAG: hypothetical protein CL961_00025 [Euryarchaeota archaeon]|nr:hypothetical protein [Euryarchaeota archaeon]